MLEIPHAIVRACILPEYAIIRYILYSLCNRHRVLTRHFNFTKYRGPGTGVVAHVKADTFVFDMAMFT